MAAPHYHHFKTVGSTNDVALDMAARGAPEGTVVVARSQTRGRGRLQRPWWDEPGSSALLSVVLRPQMNPDQFRILSLFASLIVGQVLNDLYGLPSRLKWPNDVLIKDRKIAGILIEAASVRGTKALIVGIGVNVRQKSFPAEIAASATSLALENEADYEPWAVAESVAERFLADYALYSDRGFKEIVREWRKYMWGIGKRAEVVVAGSSACGQIEGIDASGALVLADPTIGRIAIHAADAVRLIDN